MDRDAREAKAMTKELPVKDRMANFWYYKKWWIIGIAAALIVVAITVFEIVNTPQYDLYVGYYSETAVSDETVNRIKETMLDFANDVNGRRSCDNIFDAYDCQQGRGERRVCCGSNQTYERA